MPCRIRSNVNSVRVWAAAQSTDASVKMQTAEAKMVREPKRSATHPLTGMKTARVSR